MYRKNFVFGHFSRNLFFSNFGKIREYTYRSIIVFVSWFISSINWYISDILKLSGKVSLLRHLLKSLTILVANIAASFSIVQFFNLFNYDGLCYSIETKIRIIYLFHMSFNGLSTIDVIKLASNVVTLFALYVLIPKFESIFTKNSLKILAGFSYDVNSRCLN